MSILLHGHDIGSETQARNSFTNPGYCHCWPYVEPHSIAQPFHSCIANVLHPICGLALSQSLPLPIMLCRIIPGPLLPVKAPCKRIHAAIAISDCGFVRAQLVHCKQCCQVGRALYTWRRGPRAIGKGTCGCEVRQTGVSPGCHGVQLLVFEQT